ncbi:cytochrome P450 [Jiella marina]|uniref:cytochrome P450 n=1 Tax=Jiella sp. LLJ827 TaxID=2917712 RepID=UPI0021013C6F|nr:cytochrome P450 [Jiella sp. LLJ827]MCQ0988563.1 cytochrome P450 [Jiella sp. LLJ827]
MTGNGSAESPRGPPMAGETCPVRSAMRGRDDFVAPAPPIVDRKANRLVWLKAVLRYSALGLYTRQSYQFVGISRHSLPALPTAPRQVLHFLRDPALIREVLVRRPDAFPKPRRFAAVMAPLIGNGIFASNGEVWKRQRRIVDQAFTTAGVRDVFPLMSGAALELVERLGAEAANGRPIAIDREMNHYAGDIIFRTIYSERLPSEVAQPIFEAFEIFQELVFRQQAINALTGLSPTYMWSSARSRRMARLIRRALDMPLRKRLKAIAAGDPVPDRDILSSLLVARDPVTGTRLDHEELLDQIAVFFLAGHETAAAALGWTLYLLAHHPEMQRELRAEVELATQGGPVVFATIKRLEKTRNVFREAMRLYPPIAFYPRETVAEETLGDLTVPCDHAVSVPVWLMHRHEAYWPRPDRFEPARFSDPEARETVRQVYMPFSMGARVCVGASFAMQEATLVLAEILRRFVVKPDPDHVPKPVSRLTVRSENGIRLYLEPIEASGRPHA